MNERKRYGSFVERRKQKEKIVKFAENKMKKKRKERNSKDRGA